MTPALGVTDGRFARSDPIPLYAVLNAALAAALTPEDVLPPLALLVFDAAVNNGVGRAVRWLQEALGVPPDGVMGRDTLAAMDAQAGRGGALCAEFQARRLAFMAGLPTWRTFGTGWSRRLCALPFQAMQMGAQA